MSVAVFSEWLSSFGADRARMLHREDTIDAIYALLYPHQAAVTSNLAEWSKFSGLPLWGWANCTSDQAADVAQITELDREFNPSGWKLDIEGEWTKTAELKTLIQGVKRLGKPISVSLAGEPSVRWYDFRRFDLAGCEVDWQAYADSGEGPTPAVAINELYRSSLVVGGWEYRHRFGSAYGWGKVEKLEHAQALFDSYKSPGPSVTLATNPRPFGAEVVDGKLWRDGREVGLLMGRVMYSKIRVTLIVTEEIAQRRSLEQWTAYASSARAPNARIRPVAVYLAERCPDNVLRAIAAGS